jgi:hypothetical protein
MSLHPQVAHSPREGLWLAGPRPSHDSPHSALRADSQSGWHCVGNGCEGCEGPCPGTGEWVIGNVGSEHCSHWPGGFGFAWSQTHQ